MNIIEKLNQKQNDMYGAPPITIAFLGDSVTHGCFECYMKTEDFIETVYDYRSAYSTRFREIMNVLYPNVQINVINSGISGDNAMRGAARIERDVLPFNPDMVVVSYGLNDSGQGIDGLKNYEKGLSDIFKILNEKDIETVFITQNVMNSHISPHLKEEKLRNLADTFANNIQNNGVLHAYFEKAKEVCERYGIKVCDLHAVWERLQAIGVDTTELLSNKLNHPIREFHYYMAIKLIETILL